MSEAAKNAVMEGKTALGIEFGSTRIKAVLIDENHARGVFQYEDHMCYYDDCEVLQSWMVYCDDFVKGEDGAWRIQKLRMAYREMDGNFRTTMVPRDWVPDAWDTPDY